MKILFVPYGTEKAPATRYRAMQYLPHLKKQGIDYSVFSAISGFSTNLMIKSPDFAPLTKFAYYIYVFIERLCRLGWLILIANRFDLLFLQRTTFPLRLASLLKVANNRILFDIDDAIYLPDTEDNNILTRIKRYIKKSEVVNILKSSKAVIVENEHIKTFVQQYCKNIYKIPGPIDEKRFFVRKKTSSDKVVIGWIGTPATTPYLHMLDNVFKSIKKKYDFVQFMFIGVGKYKASDIEIERVKWTYETEVRNLQVFDIGIMPMPDTDWTRGKLGCKMLQYMAVGVPAVVSYTPTNAEIVKNGENGFLVTNEDEWIRVLSTLIENEGLREKIGQRGREIILEKCSLSDNVKRLIDIFKSITSAG